MMQAMTDLTLLEDLAGTAGTFLLKLMSGSSVNFSWSLVATCQKCSSSIPVYTTVLSALRFLVMDTFQREIGGKTGIFQQ